METKLEYLVAKFLLIKYISFNLSHYELDKKIGDYETANGCDLFTIVPEEIKKAQQIVDEIINYIVSKKQLSETAKKFI